MIEDVKKLIEEINNERKKENELLEFEIKQEEVAKSIRLVYDSYIKQGFTDEYAVYLAGIAYQSCFISK